MKRFGWPKEVLLYVNIIQFFVLFSSLVKNLSLTEMMVFSSLPQHEKALHALANALLEYETLSAEEIKRVLLPNQEVPFPKQEQQQQQQEEEELVLA